MSISRWALQAGELSAFTGQLLRRPRQVSALAPSSRRLCALMAAQLPAWGRRVAEFGPGTGNVTGEILRRGIAPEDMFLYEINPTTATFDGVHVHDDLLEDFGRQAVDAQVRTLGGFAHEG